MGTEREALLQAVDALWSDKLYKIILSAPASGAKETSVGTEGAPRRAEVRRIVLNRLDAGWQAERYTAKQVFHENLSAGEARSLVEEELSGAFRQCGAWDGEWEHTIRISQKGKVTGMRKRLAAAQAPKAKTEHNRKKQYLLEEGTVIPPLVDMGVFTADGKVVRSMYDKYRQINRFVELIDDEIDALPADQTIRIVDFGCGKSYLTFILYYYLVHLKGRDVRITGLDLKADVIGRCNQAAEKYGYDRLHFQVGDIGGYESPDPVDMVVSLHACDTATDHALYHAVRWKAKLIFSVPCCQHELNRQMEGGSLPILTRYGIVKERTAALMTDAVRANLLTESGYRTQLLEFVDLSHTPKNLLIRAVRTVLPASVRKQARREVEELKEAFGFQPTLDRLLSGEER
ncbi:MAG: SAM-dependent methyltransferase [Eubacteriales bacterium]|nr:SAM-dependent methyltransferase [Eubacteriales bacterium]